MNDDQDNLNVLRKIQKRPNSTQREFAKELGFSLGKFNYCIKALKQKGFIKIKNFWKFNCIVKILININKYYKNKQNFVLYKSWFCNMTIIEF